MTEDLAIALEFDGDDPDISPQWCLDTRERTRERRVRLAGLGGGGGVEG